MSLREYRRKRDFSRTREPAPTAAVSAGRAIFVVQLHHARRRHYDFRLQVGDALRSWAVPKGPSLDPSVKRLAAEVEDHPLDYAGFEGEIPAGEYGAGHVAVFDRGVWSTAGDAQAQLEKGHLRFELFGERLRGGWHLVRTRRGRARQPEWLLIKDDDEHAAPLDADQLLDAAVQTQAPRSADTRKRGVAPAKPPKTRAAGQADARTTSAQSRAPRARVNWSVRAAALPGAKPGASVDRAPSPQLARLRAAPPRGEHWLHELKWDGYRLLATIVAQQVRLWSRNGIEWTARLPDVVDALRRLGLRDAVFDGELIAGDGAQSAFGVLQQTLSGEQQAPLSHVLFDLLQLEGIGLQRVPLLARKTLLAELLRAPPPHLAYSAHLHGDGDTALRLALERGFEGIVSKRADASYRAGRGDDWIKVKQQASDEFAVVGFTPPKGAREGFGALLLARPDPQHGWRYAGRVGSGFDQARLRELAPRLARASRSTPSVHVGEVDTDLRGARWFAPRFVVEVYTRGRGTQGLLRQPTLKAIRADRQVDDLRDADAGPRTPRAKSEENDMRLTHPARVVYPDAGYTKQDVADYYAAVADHLLPEIAGRPLSIVRCPDGIAGSCFFQKHRRAGLEQVGHVRLQEESGARADYLVVRDRDDLMRLVQFNALEFHPWGARAKTPGTADRIVFDLDPGPGVAWSEVKRAARQVRDLLAGIDLVSFLRASGGKGLHVVVPLNPGCRWPLVKRFAQGFAQALAQSEPERYVAVATRARREGRIFIDYLRNGRGATSIAAYSLRARKGAPVSVPLRWDELSRLTRPDAFDLRSLPRRLARQKSDPWEGIDDVTQDLSRWSTPAPPPRAARTAAAASRRTAPRRTERSSRKPRR